MALTVTRGPAPSPGNWFLPLCLDLSYFKNTDNTVISDKCRSHEHVASEKGNTMMTDEIQMVIFKKASGENTQLCVYMRQLAQLKEHF